MLKAMATADISETARDWIVTQNPKTGNLTFRNYYEEPEKEPYLGSPNPFHVAKITPIPLTKEDGTLKKQNPVFIPPKIEARLIYSTPYNYDKRIEIWEMKKDGKVVEHREFELASKAIIWTGRSIPFNQ
jgi:hypothetical protein